MGILVGMDEAGYGPNLGPLVVAATAWEVRGFQISDFGFRIGRANPQSDLYRLLRTAVANAPDERRIAIADSKVLYRPGLGLRQLERGVHATLLAMERSLLRWSDLVEYCAADPGGCHQRLCWHDGFDCPLPVDATAQELSRLGVRLARACDGAGVRPLSIRARLVFPAELNELIDYFGSKGAALSHVATGLLRDVLEQVRSESPGSQSPGRPGARQSRSPCARGGCSSPPAPSPQSPLSASSPQPLAFVVCDKHGGRNRYAALLQHFFPDHWIETLVESQAESRYRWGPADGGVEVAFRVGGESFLPTALASMAAKYMRELAMRAFNEFWFARVPGLRPTAGYPSDSRRFHRDIRTVQCALGIDDHILWRCR